VAAGEALGRRSRKPR